jgi:hypothetical protein
MGNILYLCAPIFSGEEETENRRYINFTNWFYDENVVKEFERCGIHRSNIHEMLPRRNEISTDGPIVTEYKGMVQKGRTVRNKLESVDVSKDNYFILIDGDGDIPFESVFKVITALESGEDIVIACRVEEEGISEERHLIEQFENFVVSEICKVDLPDAQCGCWGFRTSVLRELALSANGFELEIDLAITALQNGLEPSYIPVKISNAPTETTFEVGKVDFDKLKFIVEKLKIDKYILMSKLEKFKKFSGNELPDDYMDMLNKLQIPEIKKKKLTCYYCDTYNCSK